ncbi:hemolysin family protein [Candidatus Omnitrophota bacterium]
MSETFIYLVIIFVAILFEGFFSGAEIAVISLNRIRLRILAEAKHKKAIIINKMLKNPNRMLGTTLVGTNVAVVVASSFCTKLLYGAYGLNSGWITTLVLAPIILVFGEFVPKSVFSQSADRITFYLGSVLKFFWHIFYPIVWFINIFVNLILRVIFGTSIMNKKSLFVTREEIKYLIRESEAEGEIDPHERSVIYKIFDFGRKKIKDVMRDSKELVYLSDTDHIDKLLLKAIESGFSRFPIRSQAGEFLGIVNILDVVYEHDKDRLLTEFLRPVEYLNHNVDIDDALLLLQSRKQNLAIVRDSKSKTIGFLTMEDLLEELVGEIE